MKLYDKTNIHKPFVLYYPPTLYRCKTQNIISKFHPEPFIQTHNIVRKLILHMMRRRPERLDVMSNSLKNTNTTTGALRSQKCLLPLNMVL